MRNFESIVEAILLEDKPCGCISGGHKLDEGILAYCMPHVRSFFSTALDLEECRICGAVWRTHERLGLR